MINLTARAKRGKDKRQKGGYKKKSKRIFPIALFKYFIKIILY